MAYIKELSESDLALARSLRAKNVRWNAIGRQLKCAVQTIRRRVDPEFDRFCAQKHRLRTQQRREAALVHRSGRDRQSAPRDGVAEHVVHLRRSQINADLSFQAALSAAIASGAERASYGIDTRASSPDARYHPMRGVHLGSLTGSSAGMCEES